MSVAGFEPFGEHTVNASWVAVQVQHLSPFVEFNIIWTVALDPFAVNIELGHTWRLL